MEKNKTAIYTRFSPRPDASEAKSLEVQLERCEAYCKDRSLEVVEVIRDPETSARKIPLRERDGGARLMELVRKGEISNIVVQKMDRIFRSTAEGLLCMEEWEKKKVVLHLADQGGNSINCGTAMGQFLATQILAFASLEPRMTAERTSGAMRSHQRNGMLMSKRIPYGHKLGPVVREKQTIEPDEAEQIVIGIIRLNQYKPIADIIRHLEAASITCRGKKWHHSMIRRILNREMEAAK